jgi:hypothetical protein
MKHKHTWLYCMLCSLAFLYAAPARMMRGAFLLGAQGMERPDDEFCFCRWTQEGYGCNYMEQLPF